MQFKHVNDAALKTACDLLAIPVFGDPGRDPLFKNADEILGRGLSEAARTESFEGKASQSMVQWTGGALPAKRVMVFGLGSRDDVGPTTLRDFAAAVVQMGNKVGAATVAIVLPTTTSMQYLVEGVVQGSYKFSRYLTSAESKKPAAVQSISFVSSTIDPSGLIVRAATSFIFTPLT